MTSFLLLALSATPSLLLLAFALAMSKWRRSVGAVTAVSFSLGIALLIEAVLVAAVYVGDGTNAFRYTMMALLGIPLLAYTIVLVVTVRRARIPVPGAVAAGILGLAGLYYLGGFVLIASACGYSSSGC